jgi:hypothetical protein
MVIVVCEMHILSAFCIIACSFCLCVSSFGAQYQRLLNKPNHVEVGFVAHVSEERTASNIRAEVMNNV